ncbi:OadG family protein [Geotoga petraea]|uniref:Oxaloacetate decarboxylase, gamma chain n=1 Tax=Geotoga petraea TaxID=28234 RepID=A0A1G6MR04_9BACT|nr:OadG family protein [Geotoga petraea]SDC57647.1 Oxaloacetate decarboxylase, gamma chain [Geotoga petraea]
MNNVGLITISGIFTVFTVLIILMIVYYLFGYFANRNSKNKDHIKNIPTPKETNKNPEPISKLENLESKNSDEEIAAISGAIYSIIDSSKYKIKSINKSKNVRKVNNSRWGSVPPVNTWRTNR